jgi:hypothetical protein
MMSVRLAPRRLKVAVLHRMQPLTEARARGRLRTGTMRRDLIWPALVFAAVAGGMGACRSTTEPTAPSTPPTGTLSAEARAYLEEVLGLLQAHSMNRLILDWTDFRSTLFAQASGAQTTAATHPAIGLAVARLGDRHSTFRGPNGFVHTPRAVTCVAPAAGTATVPATVGYLRVPAFAGIGDPATAFAEGLQRQIMAADRDDLAGWIVDVRGNGGGNMWPMVAGVGPILGDGVIGYFIDPAGVENVWRYRDGASWDNDAVQQRVPAPYRLKRAAPKVAVLTDGAVASSGEATVIAFKGRPNTRSFGGPTCGLSTAIEQYPLSDGATLNLAISVMADRVKTRYGYAVAPDEVVGDPGLTVERAVAWLLAGS